MSRFKIFSSISKNVQSSVFTIRLLMTFAALCACITQIHGENKPVVPLIYGGTETKPTKFPWHAQLAFVNGFCGGSFIDISTVLTAAHCVVQDGVIRRESEIKVFGGRKYIDGANGNVQEMDVSKVVIHPEYDNSSLANDIAILKLLTDITITKFVKPVALLNMDSKQTTIFALNGTVIGFGLTEGDQQSVKLREASIPVLNRESCLKHDPETYIKHLRTNMYCAGGRENVSACNGDSGGGMFFEIGSKMYLGGIVSFSPSRSNVKPPICDPSKPAVFTDVSKHSKWILRYTNTTKWLKELKSCEDDTIQNDTECNIGSRFDHDFLVAGEKGNIIRVPMNGDPTFTVREVKTLGGLDYDCVEGRFYWTDPGTKAIYSAKYDGTDKQTFIKEYLETPGHVAVDWISRRLYWVDAKKNALEVASLENPNLRTTVLTVMAETSAIAVDPLKRKLYRVCKSHGITSYNLDGSEPERLVNTTNIADIKVVMATGDLCYIVKNSSKIECLDTRTKQTRTIGSDVTNPKTLAVTDEFIYWTTENSETIKRVTHDGMSQTPLEFNETTIAPESLHAVTGVCPIFFSPCGINNGNCPEHTICLHNPRSLSGKICKCTKNCPKNQEPKKSENFMIDGTINDPDGTFNGTMNQNNE